MGTSSNSRFTFSYDRSYDPTLRSNWWNDLGEAVEAYHRVNRVYQRRFERGIVVVNPTTAPVSVTLPATHLDRQGKAVTTLTLGPNSGQVLREA